MFFLVDRIIGNVLGLNLVKCYLIFLEEKWRRIILTVCVEDRINRMMFQCRWAKRNLHAAWDIRIILNWLQNKMMFCTVFPTLLWFLAHKINIIYLHPSTTNKPPYLYSLPPQLYFTAFPTPPQSKFLSSLPFLFVSLPNSLYYL